MNETFCHLSTPLSFALLTDFHASDPKPILASLRSHTPEIILIAGDLVRGDQPREELLMHEKFVGMRLLRGCCELAPTFVSMGNHEWVLSDEDLKAIESTGAVRLDNRWVEHRGIFIGGLSSAWFTRYQPVRLNHVRRSPKISALMHGKGPDPDLGWLDEFESCPGYKILLCHHPEYYTDYRLRDRKFDLICAGHCHGGQWRYYSLLHREWRGVYAPGQGFFPSLTSGLHDGKLLISRGLTNTTYLPRFNNPTEIIYST